jgi:DNA-directed RNA polymerase II subunit RPB2
MSRPIQDNDVWIVVEAFIKQYGLVQQQLEGFNNLIESTVHRVMQQEGKFEICDYKISFDNLLMMRPEHKENDEKVTVLTPKMCIDRDITYCSKLYCDITLTTPLGTENTYKNISIGSIPIMVMSKLCNLYKHRYDKKKLISMRERVDEAGGYFIIKGQAKMVTSQQRVAYNRVYVFKNRKKVPMYVTFADIRSIPYSSSHSTSTQVGFMKGVISVMVPYIEIEPIPLCIVFVALGIKYSEIVNYIFTPEERKDTTLLEALVKTMEQSYSIQTQKKALLYIGSRGRKIVEDAKLDEKPKKKKKGVDDSKEEKRRLKKEKKKREKLWITYAEEHLLGRELFPHLGEGKELFKKKAYFLGYMVRKMIIVHLGRKPVDDRDHYANKRIATSGTMLGHLFHNAFKKLRTDITTSIKRNVESRNPIDILSIIKSGSITKIFNGAISSNKWTVRKKDTGTSQTYDRFNFVDTYSNLRKLVTPVGEDGKKIEAPRYLHNSQWGACCMYETPEGKTCGLVSNQALGCLISTGCDPRPVVELLDKYDIRKFADVTNDQAMSWAKVFVNGDMLGVTKTPQKIVGELISQRRKMNISHEVSIVYVPTHNEVQIVTDAGRTYRPLFIVQDGQLLIRRKHIRDLVRKVPERSYNGWIYLMSQGVVEFLDKLEEEYAVEITYPHETVKGGCDEEKLALTTHCEIHPAFSTLGLSASIIPFSDHNQSPRDVYCAAQNKQSVGVPGSNYRTRVKGKFHSLIHPQKPLVYTRMSKLLGHMDSPTGQSAIVALCPWEGLNQEDSIVMNENSVKRGFMNNITSICFDAKLEDSAHEQFEIPDPEECSNSRGNPRHLCEGTGFASVGSVVENGDILIGRTKTIVDTSIEIQKRPKRSTSVLYDYQTPGTVSNVQVGYDGRGYRYVRVVIAQYRIPEVGDKFSAYPGQKGTIGEIVPGHDMPFTSQGITPDILFNPLALPSRMTLGMLIEGMTGRAVASSCKVSQIPVSKCFSLDSEGYKNPSEKGVVIDSDTPPEEPRLSPDATPFTTDWSLENIVKELKRCGINGFCDEVMYNGKTGEMMKTLIYVGVLYYHRLKHMVQDKVHARSRGSHNILTRQPKEGRIAGGGLRVGYQEKTCLAGHGGAYTLVERLMEQSDETRVWFCNICGLQALSYKGTDGALPRQECRVCETSNVSLIRMPYATKLLIQEFSSINIIIRVLATPYKNVVNVYAGDKLCGEGYVEKKK